MTKYRKHTIFFVLIISMLIFSVTAISASDVNNNNNTVGDVVTTHSVESTADIETTSDNYDKKISTQTTDKSSVSNNKIIDSKDKISTDTTKSTSNDKTVAVKNNKKSVKTQDKSVNNYTDLKTQIEQFTPTTEDSTLNITLTGDEYISTGNISLTNANFNLTINGNNKTIDSNGSRFLYVKGLTNVTINNITIKNSKSTTAGGVFYIYSASLTINNANIINSTATNYGGAIYVYKGNVTVTDSSFENSTVTKSTGNGGAIYSERNSLVTLTNTNFNNNSAPMYGGAVYVYYGSDALVTNSTFTGNKASMGGAIDNYNSYTEIISSTFKDNYASTYGGAIYNHKSSASLKVNNSTFTNNNASLRGGVLYNSASGNINLENSTFTDNHAQDGSVLYTTSVGNIVIKNDTITDNTATTDTGSVIVGNTYTTASNNTFTNNKLYVTMNITEPTDGLKTSTVIAIDGNLTLNDLYTVDKFNGTITVYDNDVNIGNFTVVNSSNVILFTYNYESDVMGEHNLTFVYSDELNNFQSVNKTITLNLLGGSSFTDLQNLIDSTEAGNVLVLTQDYTWDATYDSKLTSGVVINKTITINGNGYTLNANNSKSRVFSVQSGGNLTLANATLTGANFNNNGGTLSVLRGDATVTNVTFVDNNATTGGAIAVQYGNITVRDSTFINNTAIGKKTSGGAIYTYYATKVVLTNNTFINNTATLYGGAIYNKGKSALTISNNTFTGNKANMGGVIYNFDYTNTNITDSVFTDNNASYGGVIYNSQSANVTVSNSSFVGNNATYTGGVIINALKANVTVNGSSFVNNHATNGAIIYGSAGNKNTLENNTFTGNTVTSTNGQELVVNVNNTVAGNVYDGSKINVNMTVVEPTGTYAPSTDVAISGSIVFNTTYLNKYTGSVVLYELSNDQLSSIGEVVIDGNSSVVPFELTYSSSVSGDHTIVVQYVDSEDNFQSVNKTITVAIAGVGGNSFTDLQNLIDNTANGGVLTLTQNYTWNALYDSKISNGVVINKTITINGNGYTINANHNKSRVFSVQSGGNLILANAVLTGAKFNNNAGAISVFRANATISNVTIRDNNATTGGAISVQYGNLTVRGSVFINNSATKNGGAIYTYYATKVTLINNTFINNSAVTNGGAINNYGKSNIVIANSTFSANHANYSSGAVYNYDNSNMNISGSTFVNNSARYSAGVISNGQSANLTITNSSFVGNTANNTGGVLINTQNGNMVVNGSVFVNNHAKNSTIINSMLGKSTTLSNNTFTNNTATATGAQAIVKVNDTIIDNIYDGSKINVNMTVVEPTGTYAPSTDVAISGSIVFNTTYLNKYTGSVVLYELSNDQLSSIGEVVIDGNSSVVPFELKYSSSVSGDHTIVVQYVDALNNYQSVNKTITVKVDTVSGNSFTDLQKLIDSTEAGNVLTLTQDYTWDATYDSKLTSGVVINKTITINGNGYTLNANHNKSRVFSVQSGGNLILANATLTGAKFNNNAGAISVFRANATISNVTIRDNNATTGGAIAVQYGNLTVRDSVFINNSATKNGGAIYTYYATKVTLINNTFINNSAVTNGGAINNYGKSNIVIANSTFSANHANYSSGAVYNYDNSNMNISGSAFVNNSARYSAGVISNVQSANLTIINSSFVGNVANNTGGVLINTQNGNMVVNGSVFVNNHAKNSTIINSMLGKSTTLSNNTFTNNTATATGAQAIVKVNDTIIDNIYDGSKINVNMTVVEPTGTYAPSSDITITGTLKFNTTYLNKYTGLVVLYEMDNNQLTKISQMNINGNTSVVPFELTYSSSVSGDHTVVIQFVDATNNYQSVNKTVDITIIQDSSFTALSYLINNTKAGSTLVLSQDYIWDAEYDKNLTSGIPIEKNITIDANGHTINATKSSHIFYVHYGTLTIQNAKLVEANSTGSAQGGAIRVQNGNLTVINSTFANNNVSRYGSSVHAGYSNVTIINSTFKDNVAKSGGAVYLSNGKSIIINSTFNNNSASLTSEAGGAVYNQYGNLTVINSTFTDNIARRGGGISAISGNLTVSNSTFINNNATQYGGAIYQSAGKNATIINNTIIDNHASSGSIFYTLTTNTNITLINNTFTDNTVNTTDGKVIFGNGNTTTSGNKYTTNEIEIDMNITKPTGTLNALDVIAINGNLTLNKTYDIEKFNGTITVYDNDVAIGSFDVASDNKLVSFVYSYTGTTVGKHNITFVYTDDSHEFRLTNKTITLTLNAGNSFTQLQYLIDNTADGKVLTLTQNYTWNALYDSKISSGVIINKTITINGKGYTLNANNSKSRVFSVQSGGNLTLANATLTGANFNNNGGTLSVFRGDATINNVTFVDNNATTGGAIAVQYGNITVSNSTFINNTAKDGGVIYTYQAKNVTLVGNVFSDNKATRYGGVIYNYGKSNVAVTDDLFSGNEAVYGGVIYNFDYTNTDITGSVFMGNNASYGGVIYNAQSANVTIDDSTFISNNATYTGGVIINALKGNVVVNDSTFADNHANSGAIIYGAYGNVNTLTNNSFVQNTVTSTDGKVMVVTDNGTIADNTYDANKIEVSMNVVKPTGTIQTLDVITINGTVTLNNTYDVEKFNGTITVYENDEAIDSFAVSSDTNVISFAYNYTSSVIGSHELTFVYSDESDNYRSVNKTTTLDLANGNSFKHLQYLIDNTENGGVLVLDKNYTWNALYDSKISSGVVINKTITINGNGYTLNANNSKSRVFSVQSGGNLTLANATLTGANFNNNGGTLSVFRGDATVSNVTFVDNNATTGGAIAVQYGNITVSNSTFINNTAKDGGVIYTYQAKNVTLVDNVFSDNKATRYGGVIYNYGKSNVAVTDDLFSGNEAVYGGVIYNFDYTNTNITGSVFMGNNASYGGVIYNAQSASVTIDDSTFISNNATYTGGVIINALKGNVVVNDSTFADNHANSGAIIYGAYGNVNTLENNTFIGNTVTSTDGKVIVGNNNTITNGNKYDGNEIEITYRYQILQEH